MTTIFDKLDKEEALAFGAAVELTRAQLQKAVLIVSAITGRDAEEVDSGLVGAVVQALATNQAALLMNRRDLTA